MDPNNRGPELGALALAKSLFPHIEKVDDMDEFLLFPPDLFAFTSLIFSVTGAYRLIVSPPRALSPNDSKREMWPPTEDEHMRDFSEFKKDPKDNFKDLPGLLNQLFMIEDHEISDVFRKRMSTEDASELKELYDKIKLNGYGPEDSCYQELEEKTAAVLNQIVNCAERIYRVKGDPIYDKNEEFYNKITEIFQNASFSDEFWELLEQWEKIPEGDLDGSVKRLHRLLLEAAYPNEIETSLTWDKRVRKAGLEWRKKLAHQFHDSDLEYFERVKSRAEINKFESLIEALDTLEDLIQKEEQNADGSGLSEKELKRKEDAINTLTSPGKIARKQLKNLDFRQRKLIEARESREKEIIKIREDIRKRVEDEHYVPSVLKRYWDNFKEGVSPLREGDIRALLCETGTEAERKDHWQRFISLVSMHAIADECCAGWGIRGPLKFLKEGLTGTKKSEIQQYAEKKLLKKFGSLSTINKDRCRVLPKRHTAEVGITLRSISCNLGFHRSSVEVKWNLDHIETPVAGRNRPLEALNVLLLPLPLEIRTTDFKKKDVPVRSHQKSQDFFEYDPCDATFVAEPFGKRLRAILEEAKKEAGRVDLVILPEIALPKDAVKTFENVLLGMDPPVTAYIAGVREIGESLRFNRNAVYFKVAKKNKKDGWCFTPGPEDNEQNLTKERDKIKGLHGAASEEYRKIDEDLMKERKKYIQYKHHRWKLDRSQIIQYQLGGALSPNINWWEAIKIGEREVNFINIGEQMTVCPLICEDLARQDPISDLIRTVGPTLVVAILMDGPQMLRRWAGKYASVLGDDPGSAVITLTSYGMVRRSWVEGTEPSRTISLWSSPDAKTEIQLEEGAEAVLLSLSVDERKEKSSDGREEMGGTPTLSLAGKIQIKLKDFEEGSKDLKC